MKKIVCILLALLTLLFSLTSCSILRMIADSSTKEDGGNNKPSSGSLKDGKWPKEIYSRYGIDELPTEGKIVFTQFETEGSYQYEVYYDGVTREELVAWTNSLFEKGFRAADRDKERIKSSGWDFDVMIYQKEDKQAYRMRVGFNFNGEESFEYYGDDNSAYTILEETDEYGDTYRYVQYNVSISLNPMKTQEEYEGDFPTLGLKAEDLKGIPGVRAVKMGEGAYMSSIAFNFYADHVTTEEEIDQCRMLLIDKLAEKGAKFFDALNQEKELTAEELKTSGKGTYYVQRNGVVFLLIVDPDSAFGDFGDGYAVGLTKKAN